MKRTKKRIGKLLLSILVNVILCGLVFVLADGICVWLHHSFRYTILLALLAVLALASVLLDRPKLRRRTIAAVVLTAVFLVVALGGFLSEKSFIRNGVYTEPAQDKAQAFAGKTAMLFVPHQDDDLNVLGGVTEEFTGYGSDVYVVFLTNGDYFGEGEVRLQEAIDVCAMAGVPEDHVIFLGYGSGWKDGSPWLYNAPGDMVLTSAAGRTKTYGLDTHPAYHDGVLYTTNNMLGDIQSVILEYRPDVLFCCDYDNNADHRMISVAFDRAVGQMLKQEPSYRPCIYKGFAYATAFYAPQDFYAPNVLSTVDPFTDADMYVYDWAGRTRLPVDHTCLSRSIFSSALYRQIVAYPSQDINTVSEGIINGDKVFWQRDARSLCYDAKIQTSSNAENARRLNDFLLMDNANLRDYEHPPLDNVWSPDPQDEEKIVQITLAQPCDLYSIVLYDSPSATDNILDAVIRFDDGSEIRTGALRPNGAKTEFPAHKQNVSSFTVQITQAEGDAFGLTEIEAFAQPTESAFDFIQFMDADENFAYDYRIDTDEAVCFTLYKSGQAQRLEDDGLSLTCDNAQCTVSCRDGVISVQCPAGQSAVIQATDPATGLSDAIRIRHPGTLQRLWLNAMQKLDARVFRFWIHAEYEQSVTYSLCRVLLTKLHLGHI